MPVYNVTVQDSSPMVMYSKGWIDSNASDPQLPSYSGSTYHTTKSTGATASFSFFGDAVYLFGAMRESYGPFSVSLDGQTVTRTAAVSGNSLFQQALFSETNLSKGAHALQLVNIGLGTSVDIDFITFTTGDGDNDTRLSDSIMDDTSPLIIYNPSRTEWETTSALSTSYFNSSLHASRFQGAQAVIPFTGNAISVFGSTAVNHGTFSIQVDDQDAVQLNGTASTFHPQTLLYWAGGLDSEQHTVKLTNTDDTHYVDLDYAVATSWSGPLASPTAVHASTAKTPIIAGAISGGCVGIAWIVALFRTLRRRQQRRRLNKNTGLKQPTPAPFILPPDPAVVEGGHRPGEYIFRNGPSHKASPPRPSATRPASDGTTSASPMHTQSKSIDSHVDHNSPSVLSSNVASTSAQETPPAGTIPSSSSPVDQGVSAASLAVPRIILPDGPKRWRPVPQQRGPREADKGDEGLHTQTHAPSSS